MSRVTQLAAKWQGVLHSERFRQWRIQDGPSGSYRLVVAHPAVVTAVVAAALGTILGGTFGVPPLSPLVLVAVLVAPLPLWLRVERRILDAWDGGEADDPGEGRDARP